MIKQKCAQKFSPAPYWNLHTYPTHTYVRTYTWSVPSPACVLYIGGVGKVLGVSIGLQNKRLALKPHNPPSPCSGQSSLALEYSFTHLALACLSIRYVMYPRSTLTPCPARLLLALPSPRSPSFLRSFLFLTPPCVAARDRPHAGKENKGAAPSLQSAPL